MQAIVNYIDVVSRMYRRSPGYLPVLNRNSWSARLALERHGTESLQTHNDCGVQSSGRELTCRAGVAQTRRSRSPPRARKHKVEPDDTLHEHDEQRGEHDDDRRYRKHRGSKSNCSVWKISTGSGTAPRVDKNTLTGTSPNETTKA